jgi:hypothetical protein
MDNIQGLGLVVLLHQQLAFLLWLAVAAEQLALEVAGEREVYEFHLKSKHLVEVEQQKKHLL